VAKLKAQLAAPKPLPPAEPSHTRALMVFIAKRHMKEAEFYDESNQVEGPSHRWICTFKLGGKELGRGEAPSKRHAKQLASEQALKVLLEE
jgi:dsRNA-specific ribonuclease